MVFSDDALKLGKATTKALGAAAALVERAAAASKFKGKTGATLDILAPEGVKVDRLLVIGTGKAEEIKETDLLKFGGVLAGKIGSSADTVTVIAELPSAEMTAEQAASVASGMLLRAYKFDRYKTKKKDDEEKRGTVN
ncbi:leucyl aminopeptidase, partial [Bradyrhizobium canariense]